jgi:N-acetylglucosaminyldiphosphoundecaprenol N-acetyl-beta-D-mannosaminyltransferase
VRVEIGKIGVDPLDQAQTLAEVARLVESGQGGTVFTPNVDHVVQAEQDGRLAEAYRDASISVADGMPVVWASRLLRQPVPERVAGSDLVHPLFRIAAQRGWRVYVLGGAPGVAQEALRILAEHYPGFEVAGTDAPEVGADGGCAPEVIERIRAAQPHLVFVALGCPKQEFWIQRTAPQAPGPVYLGVGASFDFIAGKVPRAPEWMREAGLEWFFRLAREPRRLWRRYLVRGPRFAGIVARQYIDR